MSKAITTLLVCAFSCWMLGWCVGKATYAAYSQDMCYTILYCTGAMLACISCAVQIVGAKLDEIKEKINDK